MENVIYKITSKINGDFYIGSSVNFNKRKNQHVSKLRNNKHENIALQRHVNKYGIDSLEFSIVEKVESKELLIEREQYYFDLLKPELNMCPVAGSCLRKPHSEETKQKMSDDRKGMDCPNKGYKWTDEQKAKLSEQRKGREMPEDWIIKNKERLSNNPPALGTKWSEERRENDKKRREEKKANTPPKIKEKKEKKQRVAWNKGIPMTEETKNKMSSSKKGKLSPLKGTKKTEEQLLKSYSKEKVYSDESKQKMRESRIAYLEKQKLQKAS